MPKLSAPLRSQHWCGRCAPGRGTFGFWKAHLKGALSPTFYECTPGRGLFGFKFSSRRHPRKFGQKRFLAVRKSWRGNGVACFWATSLEKIFGGVNVALCEG